MAHGAVEGVVGFGSVLVLGGLLIGGLGITVTTRQGDTDCGSAFLSSGNHVYEADTFVDLCQKVRSSRQLPAEIAITVGAGALFGGYLASVRQKADVPDADA